MYLYYFKFLKQFTINFYLNKPRALHPMFLKNTIRRLRAFLINPDYSLLERKEYKAFLTFLFFRYRKYFVYLLLGKIEAEWEKIKTSHIFLETKASHAQIENSKENENKAQKVLSLSPKKKSNRRRGHMRKTSHKKSLKIIESLIPSDSNSSDPSNTSKLSRESYGDCGPLEQLNEILEKPMTLKNIKPQESHIDNIVYKLMSKLILKNSNKVINKNKRLIIFNKFFWNFNNYYNHINIFKFHYKELYFRTRFIFGFNANVLKNNISTPKLIKSSDSKYSLNTETALNLKNKNVSVHNQPKVDKKKNISDKLIPLELDSRSSKIIYFNNNRLNNNMRTPQINIKKLKSRLPVFIGVNLELLNEVDSNRRKDDSKNKKTKITPALRLSAKTDKDSVAKGLEALEDKTLKKKLEQNRIKEDRAKIIKEYEYKFQQPRGLKKHEYIFSKFKYNKSLLYPIKHIPFFRKKYNTREFLI